jgi:hypothetical protein
MGWDAGEPAKWAAGEAGQRAAGILAERAAPMPAQRKGMSAGQLECRPIPSIPAWTLLLWPRDLNTGLGCYMPAGAL